MLSLFKRFSIFLFFLTLLNFLWGGENLIRGKIKRDALIRSDSTVFSEEIGMLARDTFLEIIEERYDWFKIKLPQHYAGFVYFSYIEEINKRKGLCKVNNLNIRAKPDLKSPVIGRLKKNDKVKIIERVGDWYKIKAYPYSWGWVHKNFVEICKEEPALEITKEESHLVLNKEKPPEQEIIKEKEQTPLQEIQKNQQEEKTIFRGILKRENRLFSLINYKLENEKGAIFLRIPAPLFNKAEELLNRKVEVSGNFRKNAYLIVKEISPSKEEESDNLPASANQKQNQVEEGQKTQLTSSENEKDTTAIGNQPVQKEYRDKKNLEFIDEKTQKE